MRHPVAPVKIGFPSRIGRGAKTLAGADPADAVRADETLGGSRTLLDVVQLSFRFAANRYGSSARREAGDAPARDRRSGKDNSS